MTTAKRIIKNSGVILFARIASQILNFFFFIYVAKLGVQSFGAFSLALALASIFAIFTDLGLRELTAKEIARDKTLVSKYFSNILSIKLLAFVIAIIALFTFANIIKYPELTRNIIYLISISIIFNALSEVIYGLFQAYEKMEFEAIGRFLKNIFLFFGVLIVVHNNWGILILALFYSLASIAVLFYVFSVFLLKFKIIKLELDLNFCKNLLKKSLPFALVAIFGTMLHWIDTVMLSAIKGEEVVGWYNVAYRIILVAIFIPSAVSAAIYPVMSRFCLESREKLKILVNKSFKYLTISGVSIGIFTTIFADKIILIFFGTEYAPSIMALRILIWATVMVFTGSSFSILFSATNKQVLLAKIVGISVLVNIILNFILIPKYSYIGASFTTVVSIFLLNVILFLEVKINGYFR